MHAEDCFERFVNRRAMGHPFGLQLSSWLRGFRPRIIVKSRVGHIDAFVPHISVLSYTLLRFELLRVGRLPKIAFLSVEPPRQKKDWGQR